MKAILYESERCVKSVILGFMKSRAELQKEEETYIQSLKQGNDHLFENSSSLDTNDLLTTIGMELPNKDQFPSGLLKSLAANDFYCLSKRYPLPERYIL